MRILQFFPGVGTLWQVFIIMCPGVSYCSETTTDCVLSTFESIWKAAVIKLKMCSWQSEICSWWDPITSWTLVSVVIWPRGSTWPTYSHLLCAAKQRSRSLLFTLHFVQNPLLWHGHSGVKLTLRSSQLCLRRWFESVQEHPHNSAFSTELLDLAGHTT